MRGNNIPFVDLGRQHEAIAEELNDAIQRVIRNSSFTLGEEVDRFENEFAKYCGAKYSIGVGSGTDALHFALRACGVGSGDEVITAANTFAATAEAVHMCGAKPVFVDIDEATYLIDIDAVENAITEKTKAIIPVHLYGQPVDMDAIQRIARKYDLKVIEDACQAHGASFQGTTVGTQSDASCFSFYPGKNLGAMGDGGAVVTNDEALSDRVKMLRNHGEKSKYNHVESGYCSRLHAMQAAILRVKLKYLDEWNDSRIQTAQAYDLLLADSDYITPFKNIDVKHVYHLYVIRAKERDVVQQMLMECGVGAGIHYPVPLHIEPAFASSGYGAGDLPVAERVAKEILSLPIFPYMKQEEIEVTVNALREAAPVGV